MHVWSVIWQDDCGIAANRQWSCAQDNVSYIASPGYKSANLGRLALTAHSGISSIVAIGDVVSAARTGTDTARMAISHDAATIVLAGELAISVVLERSENAQPRGNRLSI